MRVFCIRKTEDGKAIERGDTGCGRRVASVQLFYRSFIVLMSSFHYREVKGQYDISTCIPV